MLTDSDKNQLIKLEHAMWCEKSRFDLTFQERHFAPDFIEFGRSGRIYDRAQIISTTSQPINATLKNIQVRELAHDCVQILYDSVRQMDSETEYAHRSSLWQKTGDGLWQMLFHQGTPF